ncbi:chemotaxis protein [Oceanimonas smirnovii]|uniref:Chemotaxis protein n=1 Tax=Oceanimonas smirnovii TaxID=264574 RepID=A0ABW7P2A4_9GAMM
MHYKGALRLTLWLVPGLLLLGAVILWLLLQSQRELERAQQARFDYFEAANQIRMLSGQLSARVRSYAYTGSKRDLSLYYHVLAMTEGRHARVNGKTISNEQLLQSMALTREELSLLERARQATLTLARLEDEALRLTEAGYAHQARQKVFNADYDSYSELVTSSVNQFIGLLLKRLDQNIEQERLQHRYAMAAMILIFVLLILCILVLSWLLRQEPCAVDMSGAEQESTF